MKCSLNDWVKAKLELVAVSRWRGRRKYVLEEGCQTRCLYLGWFLRVQETDELDQLSPSLVTNLIWTVWIKNVTEHGEQDIQVRAERLRNGPEEMEKSAKNGPVLDIVLFQGQSRYKHWKNLVKRHGCIVAVDKSRNGARRIIPGI